MKTTLNLNINDDRWAQALPEASALSEKVFSTVINTLAPEFLEGKNEVSVNIELGNDNEIQKLNQEFRNLDKPTNILSFANIDDDDFLDSLPEMKDVELGDIIVALETLSNQSIEQQVSFKDHYIHILVHGFLHLLGYDHMEEDERREMEALEIKLLALLGVADPYNEESCD